MARGSRIVHDLFMHPRASEPFDDLDLDRPEDDDEWQRRVIALAAARIAARARAS